MDRKAWIAIILSVLGLVLWQWYYVKNYSPKPHGRCAGNGRGNADPAARPCFHACTRARGAGHRGAKSESL